MATITEGEREMKEDISKCCDCGKEWRTGTDGSHSCVRQLQAENEALKNANDKMIDVLSSISSACIGELAMGYRLDANSIGEMIFQSVGMTQPEMIEYVKNKLTKP